MAPSASTNPTLVDIAKIMDPNGNVAQIAEVLTATNEILADAVAVEGNLPTGHQSTIRASLPTPSWTKFYQGVAPTKSGVATVIDTIGHLEGRSQIDARLLALNGNSKAWRFQEDKAHLEAMNQTVATAMFYGDIKVNGAAFNGLGPRYDNKAVNTNIVNAGGSGSDCTSMWLVTWGSDLTHLIFPKGSKAGLSSRDLGEDDALDASGNPFRAVTSLYQWDIGLVVRDWRYVVRIANIDTGSFSTMKLVENMINALELLPSMNVGRSVFYCNKTVRAALRKEVMNKSNVYLTLNDYAGKEIMSFDGVPIRRCDAILNTETAI